MKSTGLILRRLRPLLPVLLLLVVLGAGCGAIAAPQGWAAPVLTSGGVLTTLHKGKLALVDPTSKSTKWEFPSASDKKTKLQGIYSNPAVTDTQVVFGGYNGHVYALNLSDGSQKWEYNTHSSIVGGVVIAGNTVIAGNSDGNVVALDLDKGTPKPGWNIHTGERVWSTPVIDADTVYVTSLDRKVYAYRLADGSHVWTDSSSKGAIAATPEVVNGHIYFGAFDKHLYALDKTSGSQLWQSPPAANWFWAQAVASDSTVYAGSLDGTIYAFSAQDGSVKWSQKLGDSVRGRPALVGGTLVVADRTGRVAGFDPADGTQKWKTELNSTALGDLVLTADKNAVMLVTEGGKDGSRLVQIDPAKGDVTVLATP